MHINGYYSVNGELFENKISALIRGSELNVLPEWHYFDDLFSKANKNGLGQIPLTEWYKQRALQLRDKYDYLILNYSGGSDSHNILQTFLKNNIKLDCVFVQWHLRFTDRNLYSVNNNIKTNDNFHSEWDLTLKKDLEWLSSNHPNIKIEIKDWSLNLNENFYKDILFESTAGVMPNISRGLKLNTFSDIETQLSERGVKVANIFGVDKPHIVEKDGSYYFYFIDKSCMAQPNPNNPNGLEYFYISPNMPNLTIEQGFRLAKWFKIYKENKFLIEAKSKRKDINNFTFRDHFDEYHNYCEIVKTVCYPNWNFNRFQAGKPMPRDDILCGLKLWDNILLNTETFNKSHQSYIYHWNSYLNLIDQKYLRGGEPIAFKTKWHYLGKI